jgi:hypothetical protein
MIFLHVEHLPLVVRAHSALKVDLLLAMFLRVVRVFGKSFQRKRGADVEIQDFASVQSYEITLKAMDDGR